LLNTHGMLADVFKSNPDGIGIMYATTKGLKVSKTLPKNYDQARSFIAKMPQDDRELAIHFRWTTHGDTDLSNCHPYDVVVGSVAMMHNGVLHTGNAKDTARSDTYHFIQDYLSEAVHTSPALVHNAGFLEMVAEFIGDNRFVFMDGDGRLSHVNREQGVEHDGLWFSNTYAWSPAMLIPDYYKRNASRYAGKNYNNAYTKYMDGLNSDYGYDEDDEDDEVPLATNTAGKYVPVHSAAWTDEDDMWPAEDDAEFMPPQQDIIEFVTSSDVASLEVCFENFPITTINVIYAHLVPRPTRFTKVEDLTHYEAEAYEALLTGNMPNIHDLVRDGRAAETVAEVICYYLDWVPKAELDATNVRPLLPAIL
jgi:predicted glutamine amidotransferase